jgi:hypothetical protein
MNATKLNRNLNFNKNSRTVFALASKIATVPTGPSRLAHLFSFDSGLGEGTIF